jgi:hypothetical protein
MQRKVFLTLTIFLLLSKSLWAVDKMYVITESGDLNIRDKPINGKIIDKVKRGDQVELLTKPEETDSNSTPGWVKVKSSKKKIGFASFEFLSNHSPAELEKSKLFSYVGYNESEKFLSIVPIAFWQKDSWKGAGSTDPDIKFILKNASSQKIKYNILSNNGSIVQTAKIDSIGETGCQEYYFGKSKSKSKINVNSENPIRYFSLPEDVGVQASTIEPKISSELQTSLLTHAKTKMKEKKFSDRDNSISMQSGWKLKDPKSKKEYAIARFVVEKDSMERYYGIVVAEISGNKVKSVVHSDGESLSDEVAPYGGQYHFLGGFHVDGQGLLMIFHHNGFDSYIHSIYKVEGNQMKEIVAGGGDAC